MRRHTGTFCVLLAGMASIAIGDVVREGAGERRTKLNAMELQPFPTEAWSKVTEWVGGKSPSASDLDGKVVVVCTFSTWYKPANRAWDRAESFLAKHSNDGLVLIGVHHKDGWKEAAKPDLSKHPGSLFIGFDADSGFRDSLMVDQDPDIYIIDRSGQLRFADIATESLDEAVTVLLKETSELAAGTKGANEKARAEQDRQNRLSGAIRQDVSLNNVPWVPFAEPAPEAYDAIKDWPKPDVDPNRGSSSEQTKKSLSLPELGNYFPENPAGKGRAIVVYVWGPDLQRSYDRGRALPDLLQEMDTLQKQYGRDALVLSGAAFGDPTQSSNSSEPAVDPATIVARLQQLSARRQLDHSMFLYNSAVIGATGTIEVPYGVVASSDGVIRWEGNLDKPGFRAAIDRVIRIDPGVKARRAAEETYLKNKK